MDAAGQRVPVYVRASMAIEVGSDGVREREVLPVQSARREAEVEVEDIGHGGDDGEVVQGRRVGRKGREVEDIGHGGDDGKMVRGRRLGQEGGGEGKVRLCRMLDAFRGEQLGDEVDTHRMWAREVCVEESGRIREALSCVREHGGHLDLDDDGVGGVVASGLDGGNDDEHDGEDRASEGVFPLDARDEWNDLLVWDGRPRPRRIRRRSQRWSSWSLASQYLTIRC